MHKIIKSRLRWDCMPQKKKGGGIRLIMNNNKVSERSQMKLGLEEIEMGNRINEIGND